MGFWCSGQGLLLVWYALWGMRWRCKVATFRYWAGKCMHAEHGTPALWDTSLVLKFDLNWRDRCRSFFFVFSLFFLWLDLWFHTWMRYAQSEPPSVDLPLNLSLTEPLFRGVKMGAYTRLSSISAYSWWWLGALQMVPRIDSVSAVCKPSALTL